ncbi:MAG: helix-turn-helix domain-containing protein, partial [Caldimicrobium sp.]
LEKLLICKNFPPASATSDHIQWASNFLRTLPAEIEAIEKEKILSALKECNFNQSKAAKKLGLTRRQLNYRLKKYFQKNNL